MGIIDRAFGVDKNSMLFNDLALHWSAVASHYENFIKNNDLSTEQSELMAKIQQISSSLAIEANESKKGFGFTSPDLNIFIDRMSELKKLATQLTVRTDKEMWLPEAIVATTDILSGRKVTYQRNQYWFSD